MTRPAGLDTSPGLLPGTDPAQGVGRLHVTATHSDGRGQDIHGGQTAQEPLRKPAMVASPAPVVPTTST